MKLSVVMPSRIEQYKGSSKDREFGFARAVQSFTKQTHGHKELVIISDGDPLVAIAFRKVLGIRGDALFVDDGQTSYRLIEMDRQEHLYSGALRQAGLDAATGEWVCYLDDDDYFIPTHLEVLAASIKANPDIDWLWFNAWNEIPKAELDKAANDMNIPANQRHNMRRHYPMGVELKEQRINTGCIAHKKNVNARWDVDILGHPNHGIRENFRFIQQLIARNPKYARAWGMGYIITHHSSMEHIENEYPNPDIEMDVVRNQIDTLEQLKKDTEYYLKENRVDGNENLLMLMFQSVQLDGIIRSRKSTLEQMESRYTEKSIMFEEQERRKLTAEHKKESKILKLV